MEKNQPTHPSDPAQPAHQSLPVLPHSNKVERMREESAAAPVSSSPPASNTAARATEPGAAAAPPFRPPPPAIYGSLTLHKSSPDLSPAQRAVEAAVVQAIRSVYDPEIPINIYELGLIYEIHIDPENRVKVKMTLTAPACPVAGSLPVEVEKRIEAIPEVKSADVELVWDPPWDKSRMSEAALLDLGLV